LGYGVLLRFAFRPDGDLLSFQQQKERRQRLILLERINATARRGGRKDAPNNMPPLKFMPLCGSFRSSALAGTKRTRGKKPPLKQLFVLFRQCLP